MSGFSKSSISFVLMAAGMALGGAGVSLSSEAVQEIPPVTPTLIGAPADDPSGGPVHLSLLRAEYEVDVLGSMVLGTLIQEFRNDGRGDVLAAYSLPGAARLSIKEVQFEIDGAPLEDPPADSESESSDDATAEDDRTAGRDTPGKSRNQVLVESGQTVTVRAGFEMTLPLNEGRFRLLLPGMVTDVDDPAEGESSRTADRFAPIEIGDPDEEEEEELANLPGAVPLSFRVNMHHDYPISDIDSRSHEIWEGYYGDRTLIELDGGESLSGRAFDLSYSLGSESEVTFVAYAGPEHDGSQQVVAVLTPPTDPWANIIRAKEVLFVLDTSGSMNGKKLDQAREALSVCLDKLDLEDRYNVVEFDTDSNVLAAEPREVSEMPPDEARDWLDTLQADGGTNLLPGLKATLKQPESDDHHRMIVILSDGGLADEEKALELLENELGAGRLFVVGIGKQVKRDAIKRIAERGRGIATFAADAKALEPVVARLFDSVAAPMAWDLEIDFGGVEVEAIQPDRLPDLYANRTVTVMARVAGPLPDDLVLYGVTTDGEQTWTAAVRTFEGGKLKDLPVPETSDPPEETAVGQSP
jgi:Ca-activated chloride channel family protein